MNFGELVGTFLLLVVGLGSGLVFPQSSRWRIGLFWALAVLVGATAGSLLGTADMNIVFSLMAFLKAEISAGVMIQRVVGQSVGALLAAVLLIAVFGRRQKLHLQNFAAVGGQYAQSKKCVWEFFATLSMLVVAALVHLESVPAFWQNCQISLFIGLLISILAPLSGASFNPIRDFIPRFFYCAATHDFAAFKRSVWSANAAPLVAGIVGSQLLKILSL